MIPANAQIPEITGDLFMYVLYHYRYQTLASFFKGFGIFINRFKISFGRPI
jgi:hypothetical protein